MKLPRWTRRLLRTTRGRIILLLREQSRTVAELAEELDLTGNAVRAHLGTLERDGLVHQKGERAAHRKPHFSYELTAEADELFTKAYGPILNQLVTVLKERSGTGEAEAVLREVGRRFAQQHATDDGAEFEERLAQAVSSLGNLGSQATVTQEDGKVVIRSGGCPFSAAAGDHAEICKMLETFLVEIIGAPVQQACQREPSPQCCFEIQPPTADKKASR